MREALADRRGMVAALVAVGFLALALRAAGTDVRTLDWDEAYHLRLAQLPDLGSMLNAVLRDVGDARVGRRVAMATYRSSDRRARRRPVRDRRPVQPLRCRANPGVRLSHFGSQLVGSVEGRTALTRLGGELLAALGERGMLTHVAAFEFASLYVIDLP
ncbi:MAG TPA: hypothetical protein VM284_00050, partial [Candidatus Limnocylindria bacterium]|nr:hypothetical protein [Candidatus Limnocylindria bacterium]